MDRLAGREYRINESREGEWTVKWFDAHGDVVAWFSGDVRTDSQFGIVVDRVWQREPEFSAKMRLLSERVAAAPQTDLKKRVKRQRRK